MRGAERVRPQAYCPPLLSGELSEDEAAELSELLKVMADPARLRLLSVIAAGPDGEACVCDLVGAIDRSQPTVSHHLKVLHDAGFLERDKRGTWVWYRVVPERLDQIRMSLGPPGWPRSRRRA